MFINIILWDPCCSYVLMLIPWDWSACQENAPGDGKLPLSQQVSIACSSYTRIETLRVPPTYVGLSLGVVMLEVLLRRLYFEKSWACLCCWQVL